MDVKWLVEHDIFEENLEPMIAEIKKQGMEVEQIKYMPFESGSYDNFAPDDCVMCYGSLNLIRQLMRQKPWIPGAFCNLPNFECSSYYAHFGEFLFNQDYMMLPLAEFKRRSGELFQRLWNGEPEFARFFVRPSSGFKTFSGQVIEQKNFEKDYGWFKEFSSPEALVVIAPCQEIRAEWRLVIAARKVIAASKYKVHDRVYLSSVFIPDEVVALGNKIAQVEWQPDPMYMIDIAEGDLNEFWLLEMNSFSCSGLYACEVEPIVREASRLALQEWKEINDG